MKAVIQRVLKASVSIDKRVTARIGRGLLIFLGIGQKDSQAKLSHLAKKTANLRVFSDEKGKMNLSIKEIGGSVLVVSQFTLYGDIKKGNRPSFIQAADPKKAENLYKFFLKELGKEGIKVKSGQFRAMMDVELVNSGPVTLIIDF